MGNEGKEHEVLVQMRAEAREIFMRALQAVEPCEAVKGFVQVQGDRLTVGRGGQPLELDLNRFQRISLVGAGKATAPMARAIEELLGGRLAGGLINVKYGFSDELRKTEVIEAGHPLPDVNGLKGTEKILNRLAQAGEGDLVFSLISGGGSALLPAPTGGISLAEKQALTRQLLACGASIDEINAVRKHVSQSKGGQLARAAYPATVVNLMLSDVVGDRLDVIASGPFVADPSTYQEVMEIFRRYGLKDLPASIEAHLKAGLAGTIPETPKPGDPVFERVHNVVVGSNILALEAAAAEARRLGYETLILSSLVEGETREVARVHSAVAREILKTGRPLAPPACIISGGETTVTIRGDGLGGRNQEFCLAAALDLQDTSPRVVMLSAGTDGNDGPTDAAGAVIDPLTVKRGAELGLRARQHLENNDAYPFFARTNDLLLTGPTRTNVMDVRIVLAR